jgi:hypothetical protein
MADQHTVPPPRFLETHCSRTTPWNPFSEGDSRMPTPGLGAAMAASPGLIEILRSRKAGTQSVRRDPGDDAHVQELNLRSLKRMINQMKEEIARYESRRSPRAGHSAPEVVRAGRRGRMA